MLKLTAKQIEALFQVYLRWQNITPCPIMPTSFFLISEEEYGTKYHGIWVGKPHKGNPGSLFLGIESDGYTHS